ncbi:MAG: SPASM domain-containing protein [Muribaculaceae bacterium]|nr:SPASM domain-containing protein [Muribaculaceae bacterium]MDE6119952.1 SPASM domain-containing protein [Muribaculaceae bacterium]
MEIIFITYHDDTLCGCDTFITELSQPLSETDGANVSVVTFGYPHPYKRTGIQALPFYPLPFKSECSIRNRNSIVIGPNGELYKCWQDVGIEDKIYGYIDGRVTNEKVLLEYLMDADPLDDEECRECLLFPICSGGCPYARIKAQRDSKFSKPCPLYKDKLIDFLTLHYRLKRSQLSQ